MDLQAIPYMKKNSHFPIIVDPSHASGKSYMIESMSLAAIAAGCDGLMIEVHDKIEEALSDKEQAIDIEQLKKIMDKINKINFWQVR